MENHEDRIGKYISILHRSGSAYISKRLAGYNIGIGQYIFLIYLSHLDGISQDELSSRAYLDKSTTAKAVKKLEEEGYITRITDEKDSRSYRVYLTDKSNSIMGDIYAVLDEWNNILTAGFTEHEKETALELLKRMLNNKNNI